MLLLVSTALFLSFMSGSAKNNVRQELKSEGNSALTQIEYLLRNSRRIDGCAGVTNSPTLDFSTLDGRVFTLSTKVDGDGVNRIWLEQESIYLTSNKTVTSNLNFDCFQASAARGQYVDVEFDLTGGSITEEFSSGIMLRNTGF